jgi:DNA-binding CsgD family transcriptional regulator
MDASASRQLETETAAGMLAEADVRALVRLLGEVAALPGGHAEKKRHLMDGLCGLIGADAWVWALACQYEAGRPPVYAAFMHGGFRDEQFPKYLAAVEHSASAAMTVPFIDEVRERRAHLTRTIEQISHGQFADFEAAPLWREADVGTLILSSRPLDERSASGIGIYRDYGRPAFTPKESRIAHILLTEVPWLHKQGWPEDRGSSVPDLPPRQRMVLNLLIEGLDRQTISDRLRISPHTANDYVKAVYRHFGVSTQAALMRRFHQGDGGDLA